MLYPGKAEFIKHTMISCDSVRWTTIFPWFYRYVTSIAEFIINPGILSISSKVVIHLTESQEIIISILLIPYFAEFCDCVNVFAVHNLTFLTVINCTFNSALNRVMRPRFAGKEFNIALKESLFAVQSCVRRSLPCR